LAKSLVNYCPERLTQQVNQQPLMTTHYFARSRTVVARIQFTTYGQKKEEDKSSPDLPLS
jgi:hypothetical protein